MGRRTVVASAFVSMGVVFGAAYSFGAFFAAIADELGAGSAQTATVFSIMTFSFLSLGAVTGRLADRFGARPLILTAAGALGVGLWATAQVQSVVVGYLTFGFGAGLAAACGYIPAIAAVGRKVTERQAVALGIAISGIGVGTLIATPLAAWLIGEFGWRRAYEVLAVAGAGLLVLAAVGIGGRVPPASTATSTASPSLLRNRNIRIFAVAGICFTLALFVPFVFVPPLAVADGVDPVAASLLVGLLGGGSILARLGSGPAVERLGSLRTFRACFVLHAASYPLWWLAGGSYPLLVVFVLVHGIAYGGFVAVSASVVSDGFGAHRLGSVLGIIYAGAAVGSLIGPPMAGRILDSTGSLGPLVIALTAAATLGTILLWRVPIDAHGRLAP
jgi:MFS family permease